MTKGMVVQFRRGRKTQKDKHFLIEIPGCDDRKKAEKYVGEEVIWTSPGKNKKMIKGVVASPHGNKGVLRCIFERGLPGQAVTTEVILEKKVSKETKKIVKKGDKE